MKTLLSSSEQDFLVSTVEQQILSVLETLVDKSQLKLIDGGDGLYLNLDLPEPLSDYYTYDICEILPEDKKKRNSLIEKLKKELDGLKLE